jgi:citrate lyase subunit beta/citryl-CoA lyase
MVADDLNAAAKAKPDAVLVPRYRSRHLEDVAERLVDISADQKIRIWAMMETPLAMLNAGEIAGRGEGRRDQARGFRDGHQRSRQGHARERSPRRAADGAVADGLRDGRARPWHRYPRRRLQRSRQREGFARECAEARDMGFDGKTLIHPNQIGPCNAAFSPSAEEVANARKIIAAFRPAGEQGQGRRPARRPHGGTAACRHGAANTLRSRGDRGTRP